MKRVLVVDDVEEVRYALNATLSREGYEVVEAEDGQSALNLMAGERFDVIVTDLWMPRMDGVELIRALRRADDETKIIAISGGAPKAPINFSVALAETWGADAVFIKPFDQDELVEEMRRMLG